MPAEHPHHPSGPLVLAVVLGAVAGFVDAHVYLNVTPVFVANMSGNLIHLGMFAGSGRWEPAVGSGVAVAAFLAGVVVATVHHDRQVVRGAVVRPHALVSVEALLVLALPALLAVLDVRFEAHTTPRQYPVLVVAGLAMGLQTAALRRVGEIAVATTYGTGAIVRIGEKLALGARGADRAGAHRRRRTIAILVAVLASYVAGAAAAAWAGSAHLLLLVPGTALALTAIILHRRSPGR